uniref:Uncharacterized protein n=1 Tax=Chromera velia CCMP2878 TaxID=1169474 RepID=A0A0G4H3T4_9ALVE|eukprot:Cvel_24566.t1-p1 / transcript=Cvel_24566.t1 / gene=Cvel_24566 / organism=Chromera_velia_CCMP2878 / gene_product=hypothetical protein / transcript_product=hypothetical protein / location=Cvel_scaffold2672:21013-22605(+) / protein_length=161 / sequence_SO=supercontig / SO=protein_coding / is_pseudo=false
MIEELDGKMQDCPVTVRQVVCDLLRRMLSVTDVSDRLSAATVHAEVEAAGVALRHVTNLEQPQGELGVSFRIALDISDRTALFESAHEGRAAAGGPQLDRAVFWSDIRSDLALRMRQHLAAQAALPAPPVHPPLTLCERLCNLFGYQDCVSRTGRGEQGGG